MNKKQIFTLTAVIALVASYLIFDLDRFISVSLFQQFFAQSPWQAGWVFAGIYIVMAGLSLPGAGALTLLAGVVFGLGWGTLIVSFASSLGATLAMLVARVLLRDWVSARFQKSYQKINAGVQRGAARYLFTLRMIPIVPYFVINLVFGLVKMRAWQFYLVSQIGMLPATLLYVNAGAQLGEIEQLSFGAVFSPQIIIAFAALIAFPYIVKAVTSWYRRWQQYRPYVKPKKFDVNLLVIGAGSGGLVSAYIAAAVNAKVLLVEKHRMGGDCLNTGCVPSKALLRSAHLAYESQHSEKLGVVNQNTRVDFGAVMAHVKDVIQTVAPHDSTERYEKLGVNCLSGTASIKSPYEVEVDGKVITTRAIIVATGARPRELPIPGLHHVPSYTSDTIWTLTALPKRLLIIGAGPVGCELGQAFSRLGAKVAIVTRGSRILPSCDQRAARLLHDQMESEGIDVFLSCEVEQILHCENSASADLSDGRKVELDALLFAVGRQANTEDIGLQALKIKKHDDGRINVNEHMQTNWPTIYACGDVAGPYQLTHAASHQAWYATVNALFGRFKTFKVDYRALPSAVYTDPEIAQVGETQESLDNAGRAYEIVEYDLAELDRAIAERRRTGFVKVFTAQGKDTILGATIVGAHAGELIQECVFAINNNVGLNAILSTIHSYPTWSESVKYAAGEWKRQHAPLRILRVAHAYHAWRRGARK